MNPNVYLIGGAPGAGKTTLGSALAAKLGSTSLSIDDLITAVQAVTTPETHPGLHLMWKTSHLEYFTDSSVDRLIDDAKKQHEAAWQAVRSVINKHARGGSPIVMDGWHLWPSRVAQLQLENVWAGWIVVSPDVMEQRERDNTEWMQGSSDPERMLNNFLARSFWFNNFIQEQATVLQMNVLHQRGNTSVDALCEMILGQ